MARYRQISLFCAVQLKEAEIAPAAGNGGYSRMAIDLHKSLSVAHRLSSDRRRYLPDRDDLSFRFHC